MRIVIVGAGKSGAYLAERLRSRHQVTVVDQREDRIDALRTREPDLTYIHGDGCEPTVLDAARVAEAEIVCAVTGDDEDNLVISLLSKRSGAGRVLARVNHPNNHWIFTGEWGVDVALCAADIMYDLVEKEIGLSDVVSAMALKAHDVSIEEIVLPEGAAAAGKTLEQAAIPPGLHVMAVLSESRGVRIPKGDTVLAAGDQLLLLCEGTCHDTAWDVFVGGE